MHPQAETFASCLAFPNQVDALIHRVQHLDRAGMVALKHTCAAVPAFIRVQDYRWLFFDGIGHQHIRAAYLHAQVAAVTEVWVKFDGSIWSRWIWKHKSLMIHKLFPSGA